MNEAEVLVVGGGPAGSSVAFALARAGTDVLLLDRARFPRPKPCAEYLSPEASRILADMGALDPRIIEAMDAFIRGDRQLNWKVVQRGFWVHGVSDLRAYLASTELFTMRGRAELIRCPTLLTQAEGDGLGAGAGAFHDALRCPKTLMRFTAAEGAEGHCEMGNRSLLNGRVLDWLDEQFGTGPK